MTKEQLNKFLGGKDLSIVDAMSKIDSNTHGILFIMDENKKLIGCITDGDIRRWLIKTGDLNVTVEHAMTRSPKYLMPDDKATAEETMRQNKITAIPIVSDSDCIEDIVLLDEFETNKKINESNKLAGVPVVVMAGGKGTRLYPYTKILPKPLIPIGETPIIERIFDCFSNYGVNKFYITLNYKKEMIKAYFSDLNPDYELVYVEENMPLGTGGSIKLIKEKFQEPIFVTNCDSLILTDYSDLYDYHIKSENDITVVSAVKNITVPYGVMNLKDNGELDNIEEKPKLSYLVNTGMYVINPETINLIPDNTMFHMTHLVEAVMNKGGKVGSYPVSEDSFLDMGEFDEMHRMEDKLNLMKD